MNVVVEIEAMTSFVSGLLGAHFGGPERTGTRMSPETRGVPQREKSAMRLVEDRVPVTPKHAIFNSSVLASAGSFRLVEIPISSVYGSWITQELGGQLTWRNG